MKILHLFAFLFSLSYSQYLYTFQNDPQTIRLYHFNYDALGSPKDESGHQDLTGDVEYSPIRANGSHSLYLGNKDQAIFGAANDAEFNVPELTIEFYLRYESEIDSTRSIISLFSDSLRFLISSSQSSLKIDFSKKVGSVENILSFSTESSFLEVDRWYYVAFVYAGSLASFYIDGELINSELLTFPFSVYDVFSTNDWHIGRTDTDYKGNQFSSFDGYVDMLRISSVAREIPIAPTGQFGQEIDTVRVRRGENLRYTLIPIIEPDSSAGCFLSYELLDEPDWISLIENSIPAYRDIVGDIPFDANNVTFRAVLDCYYYSSDTLELVVLMENERPIIDSVYISSNVASLEMDSVVYEVFVIDDDMSQISYIWKINGTILPRNSYRFVWKRDDNEARIDTISLDVSDGEYSITRMWALSVEGEVVSVIRKMNDIEKSRKEFYDIRGRKLNRENDVLRNRVLFYD